MVVSVQECVHLPLYVQVGDLPLPQVVALAVLDAALDPFFVAQEIVVCLLLCVLPAVEETTEVHLAEGLQVTFAAASTRLHLYHKCGPLICLHYMKS